MRARELIHHRFPWELVPGVPAAESPADDEDDEPRAGWTSAA